MIKYFLCVREGRVNGRATTFGNVKGADSISRTEWGDVWAQVLQVICPNRLVS